MDTDEIRNSLPNKTEWVGGEVRTKDVRVFSLVDSKLYKRVQQNPKDPDLYRGIEYEPYSLWVIQSGFKDLFHVIIESPEWVEPEYKFLNAKQIEEQFDITLE